MNRRHVFFMLMSGLVAGAGVHQAEAGVVQTFTDRDAFLAAAGNVREIDFETLPNGNPSFSGALITPEFNYTNQGVTFSSPFPELRINGSPGGFSLLSINHDTGARNWLIADFVIPAVAVGIVFSGHTTLSAFDGNERLLASIFGGAPGGGHFLGIVSSIPIDIAIGDLGAASES